VRRFQWRTEEEERPLVAKVEPGTRVRADRLRLEQALANLVDNALRYGRGSVSLGVVAEDGTVELHVQDEGPGFAPQCLGRAFERFTRSPPSGERSGTGLGLSIVRAIAVAHGGEAHAANAANGGAHVWVVLPNPNAN